MKKSRIQNYLPVIKYTVSNAVVLFIISILANGNRGRRWAFKFAFNGLHAVKFSNIHASQSD